MRDFKRGGGFGGARSGGRPSFGGRKSFGDRGDRPTVMHKATCSECNEECEVPFRPTGDKPVYCRGCFGDKGGSDSGKFGGRKDFGRRDEPRSAPRYDRATPAGGDVTAKQLEEMNSKLEKIIKLLEEKL